MTDTKVEVPQPNDLDTDYQERIKGFVEELRPLLGKFELGIAAFPEFAPDGTIQAKAIFVSTRKQPGEEAKAPAPEATVEEDKGGLSE